MAAEPTSRFAHLLQPIRDLSKVWKIEIAEELERYIEEVAELLVTNPEDGISQLNFAEAALLIQGSTAIYSRKVELLYQLVYQALDLLSLDRGGRDAPGRRGKAVQSGLWAQIPDTDELLTIDHLIKEGRNILLDHSAPEHRQALQRRVPLFLMPRDQSDRRKHEFRISSCTVHHTGAYLLQESDAKLLDDVLDADEEPAQGDRADGPLVPAPPREVQDLDDRLQELLRGLPPEDLAAGAEAQPGSPTAKEQAAQAPKDTPMKLRTPMLDQRSLALAGVDLKRGVLSAPDPWALLDEHEVVGQDTPLQVGKTSKRVNAKKLLASAEGLPEACSTAAGGGGGLEDAEMWRAGSAEGAGAMLAAGHPVEALFLSVAGQLKSGGRYEVQRAGFSAAWLEFEDLFAAAAAKRRQQKAAMRRPGAAGAGPPGSPRNAGSEDEASDGELPGGGGALATPRKTPAGAQGDAAWAATPLPGLSEEHLRQEEQRKEVAMLESMIQDAQGKYESTIRQHLQALQKDGVEGDDPRFPELYANVRRWQDQLEPVLREFESRPEFDIHEYKTKFIAKLNNIQQGGDVADRAIPFARLVHGQPRWEVCRRFLTCLFLTNHGSTDIVYATEQERMNNFGVKLLKGA